MRRRTRISTSSGKKTCRPDGQMRQGSWNCSRHQPSTQRGSWKGSDSTGKPKDSLIPSRRERRLKLLQNWGPGYGFFSKNGADFLFTPSFCTHNLQLEKAWVRYFPDIFRSIALVAFIAGAATQQVSLFILWLKMVSLTSSVLLWCPGGPPARRTDA